MELDQLRALRAVVAEGSVGGAAASLFLTASAVSQRLARLERAVGQPLLERTGRGVRATPAGALLAAHADDILAAVDRAAAQVAALRSAVVGELRLAAFASAARALLPPAVRDLHRDHPSLRAQVAEQEPDEAVPLVVRGAVDVAVVQDWPDSPLELPAALRYAGLLRDPVDLAVPVAHRLAGRAAVTLADVGDEPWITWPRGQLCHDWFHSVLAAAGATPRVAHTAAEYGTQLALVAAGCGVALVPRLGRGEVPDQVRTLPLTPAPHRRVYAVWHADRAGHPAVTAAVCAIRASAAARRRSTTADGNAGPPEIHR